MTQRGKPAQHPDEIMRDKFIDEVVLDEPSDRLDELVLLGSGLDTRPYRLADRLQGVRVIEVDHPENLESKQRLRSTSARASARTCPPTHACRAYRMDPSR